MPVVPQVGLAEAETVARIYRDAELAILEKIVRQLSVGIDTPGDAWAAEQLGRLQQLSEDALRELAKVNPGAVREIRSTLSASYDKGGAAVLADLGAGLDPAKAATSVKRAAVQAFASEVTGGLAQAQSAIVRTVPDVVREVVTRTVASTITGTTTRREAAQTAISELLGHGLTGIQSGRGTLSLGDYAAMAVRTSTARAAITGHTATMLANGLTLVVIHPGPRPCDICDEWARGILSLDGTPEGVYEVQGILGGTVEVEVMGTLEDAQADGFQHPNCRCGIGSYLPGVTDPAVIDREPWDQAGYEAQQRQRDIEREIRSWKLEAVTSLTDDRRAEADGKVADWQQAMRDHLAQHDELKRQSVREQIDGPARK